MDDGYPVVPVLSILNCGFACPPACYCSLSDPSVCCCPLPCPPGCPGAVSECACVAQMRNLLRQFIKVYGSENLTVTADGGNVIIGRPYALLPAASANPNAGLFQLADEAGVPKETVPVCRIAAVCAADADYDDTLEYLKGPASAPGGCGPDCLSTISGLIPAGTEHVVIKAGGQTFGEGTIKKSEYGIAVLAGPDGSAPVFVSICKAEIIRQ